MPLLTDYRIILLGAIGILAFVLLRLKRTHRGPYPLPPGPPGKPIVGHLGVIPALNPEFQYIKWGKEYSKLLSTTRVGSTDAMP